MKRRADGKQSEKLAAHGQQKQVLYNRDRKRDEEVKAWEPAPFEQLDRNSIIEQYLGSKKPKKQVMNSRDKLRPRFEHQNTDDTSIDMNPLYQNPHQAKLCFGRGFLGGIDRLEQKKLALKSAKGIIDKVRYGNSDMRVYSHWSEKKLEEMTERDWTIFREDYSISCKGFKKSKIPSPMRNWAESRLRTELLQVIDSVGYKTPSPIQMAAIPIGLQQRDLIGIAGTGSGKTAAFVLPMLHYISRLPPINEENDNAAEGPYAVVMAPTRELALQIEAETVKFSSHLGIKVISIVGGQSIMEQSFKFRQGCEVLIATPGRLIDCLDRRYVVLNQCNYVVLDEADRMIDLGFESQIVQVFDKMPSSNLKPENADEVLDEKKIYRTTYMFSATMPPKLERLAKEYLRNPVVVTVADTNKLISQRVILLKESEKFDMLKRLLDDELGVHKRAIVFVNTKDKADKVSKSLGNAGYRVTAMHAGMLQGQRNVSLEGFKDKRYNVLVATDVAGRGIDIPALDHVINYDRPLKFETYTHRIGRTGRAGKTGMATTFVTRDDSHDLPPELAKLVASARRNG